MPNKDGLDDIRIIIGREVSEQRAVRKAQMQQRSNAWAQDPISTTTTAGTAQQLPQWTTTTSATTAFQAYVRPGYLLE